MYSLQLELIQTESDEKMSEPFRKKILIIGAPNVGKGQGSKNHKLGCVVRMVVGSILLHAEYRPNYHRKDAPPFRRDFIRK